MPVSRPELRLPSANRAVICRQESSGVLIMADSSTSDERLDPMIDHQRAELGERRIQHRWVDEQLVVQRLRGAGADHRIGRLEATGRLEGRHRTAGPATEDAVGTGRANVFAELDQRGLYPLDRDTTLGLQHPVIAGQAGLENRITAESRAT